jgi:UDP:flavonoid glycosyltransferase YjiC (YdhE family)
MVAVHTVFAAPGAYGLVNPMIPLALALQRAGHTVHWATSPSLCRRLAAAGFATTAMGLETETRHAALRSRYPDEATLAPEARRLLMFPKLFGEIEAPVALPQLLEAAAAVPPDVIVHSATEFASAIVADRLGVPHVTHGFGALVRRDILEAASREVEPLWESVGSPAPAFGGSYQHLYLDIYPTELQPAPQTHVPRVQPLRPIAVDAGEGEVLPSYLDDSSRPIVYVTFGTVFNPAVVFAPVLEAARTLDATFIVTVGPDGDPAALGTLPGNVAVERYVSQSLLLDRCAVVVSHAGSGTFLAALARGIPQLCIPQAADQFVNAAACEKFGAGLALAPGTTTTAAIAAAIGRLLHDPAFRARADAGAAAIAAMPSPDEVVATIEALV